MNPIALTVILVALVSIAVWLVLALRMWRLERRWRRRARERSVPSKYVRSTVRSDGELRERERYLHHAWRPLPVRAGR